MMPHFSYLNILNFSFGELMFNGKKLTLKLYTIRQTNFYVVYWYFMNIITIFINYWLF